MVAARSAAMALNRLIDAGIDARNPRTAQRELPAGRLSQGRGRGLHGRLARRARAVHVLPVAALPLPVADRRRRLHRLPLHQALHLVLPLRPGADRRPRAGGGLGRGLGQPRAVAGAAVPGRGAVGRRLRRDLRDLRPRLRPPRGHPLDPGDARLAARAAGRRAARTWPRSSCSSPSGPCSAWACPTRPAACWSPPCSPGRTSTSPGAAWPAWAWGS